MLEMHIKYYVICNLNFFFLIFQFFGVFPNQLKSFLVFEIIADEMNLLLSIIYGRVADGWEAYLDECVF